MSLTSMADSKGRCLLPEAGDGEPRALILFALLGPVHVQSHSTGHTSNATDLPSPPSLLAPERNPYDSVGIRAEGGAGRGREKVTNDIL
jgi:hypothetical protein